MTYKTIGTAPDFCDNRDLEVSTQTGEHRDSNPAIPSTVTLKAGGGGCHFQWSMTSAGARDLAELLLEAALRIDEVDAMEGAQ